MTLNKKKFVLKVATQSKPDLKYTCSEIRRQVFKSGAEGIVITFTDEAGKIVRKYDILKNKDGSTLQSQIDTLKKDLNIIDPSQSIDMKKMFAGIVLKMQSPRTYNLTFTPEGYVQHMITTH